MVFLNPGGTNTPPKPGEVGGSRQMQPHSDAAHRARRSPGEGRRPVASTSSSSQMPHTSERSGGSGTHRGPAGGSPPHRGYADQRNSSKHRRRSRTPPRGSPPRSSRFSSSHRHHSKSSSPKPSTSGSRRHASLSPKQAAESSPTRRNRSKTPPRRLEGLQQVSTQFAEHKSGGYSDREQFRGPELIGQFDFADLQKITVVPKFTLDSTTRTSNAENLVLQRRPGEGQRPLFDRAEIREGILERMQIEREQSTLLKTEQEVSQIVGQRVLAIIREPVILPAVRELSRDQLHSRERYYKDHDRKERRSVSRERYYSSRYHRGESPGSDEIEMRRRDSERHERRRSRSRDREYYHRSRHADLHRDSRDYYRERRRESEMREREHRHHEERSREHRRHTPPRDHDEHKSSSSSHRALSDSYSTRRVTEPSSSSSSRRTPPRPKPETNGRTQFEQNVQETYVPPLGLGRGGYPPPYLPIRGFLPRRGFMPHGGFMPRGGPGRGFPPLPVFFPRGGPRPEFMPW